MAKPIFFSFNFTLFLILIHLSLLQSSPNPDFDALIAFKSSSNTDNNLPTWASTTNFCTWSGVTCYHNRVTKLVLEDLELTGSIQPLTSLTHLRVLSLKNNLLSGPIPSLANFTALKLLFLSHNQFSGDFPALIPTLTRLFRLDLAYNNFSGDIPETVNHLTHLLTLRLEHNQFSGPIPNLNLSNLQDFNVSGNRLSGEVPKSVSSYPESCFSKNRALCGSPLQICNSIQIDPTKSGSEGAMASPLTPAAAYPTTVIVPSSPGSDESPKSPKSRAPKITPLALIAIVLGDVLVLFLISLFIYCYFWRNYAAKMRNGKGSKLLESEKIVYSSSPYPAQSGFDRGRMVFFEGVRRFELEDLLRASAEMLGKGGFGTAYKAVLDDGSVVVVKRLKDAHITGRREFEQHMEVLGKMRHPNIVSLRAYYFAREEKLLVHDYMPNGSLFWLLHGNRGPGRTPLDWTTRLKIVAGAAQGLAFIHDSCKSLKLAHGNIKSTNILRDQSGNARITDFGLSFFASSVPVSVLRANGYRAPESLECRKLTQKSDVYSFGVLLLEVLTGKCPSVVEGGGPGSGYGGCVVDLPRWVQSVVREEWTAEVFDLELMRYKDIEEELVTLLQIAVSCTAASPDQRPRMSNVVRMIQEIQGVEVSPSLQTPDNMAESPAISEDAARTSH